MVALRLLAVLIVFDGLPESLHAPEDAYARPDLLVEPQELAKPDVAKGFVVLDARDQKKYGEGRVPLARWVDHAGWAKAFGDGRDAAGWSQRVGGLGIAADSKVVVYDDNFNREAARIWWILRYWGLKDVRLLNGGWTAWKAAGLPVETQAPRTPEPAKITLAPIEARLATKASVLDALKSRSFQIVDSRSAGEFCGTERMAKRAGAIPGAKHLEWIDAIDKKTGRFKTAVELRKLLESAGIDVSKPVVTHCQSGGRASVTVFALELLGAEDVRNYYASWAEWGNAEDTPVVPGKVEEKHQEK